MVPIIQVEHLVKQYRKADQAAVRDISFNVQPGELFAFLGPNGAGKTTTISILTTTFAKTSGSVTIAGYDLDTQAKLIRRAIGIIFQNQSLDLSLTAEENIRLHVSLYGLYGYRPLYRLMPGEYRQRITDLAEIIDLKENMFKPLKAFSGGMKRKLEIIRSLMHHPQILFLDEPTSGLDVISRRSLWEYLQQIRAHEQTTIFLTTHYLEEAESADLVCVINHGRVALLGSPEEMKRQLVDKYILLDADDRQALKAELQALNQRVTEADHLKVRYDGETPQALLMRLKTPLSVLRVYEPMLEEAYIDLLSITTESP